MCTYVYIIVFTELRLAYQVAEEARLITPQVTYRNHEEEKSTKLSVLRRFFRRSYREAREQATSTLVLEWMVNRMSSLMGESKWCILLNEGIMDLLFNASRCKGPTPDCTSSTINKFRTIDGTCNNPNNPTLGAAFTPFRRLLSPVYEDGISQPVGFQQAFIDKNRFGPTRPSARLISTRVIRDLNISQPGATHMLMQWGQFLDHDYAYLIESSTLSGEEIECNTCEPMGECLPIHVPKDDPQFGVGTIQNGNCLSFIRAGVSCVSTGGIRCGPRQQLNQITHWIDASNVYGSLPEEQPILRLSEYGLLREGPEPGTLPEDPNPRLACPGDTPCFRGGDLRANEQVVLTVMHTIFLREHNRIAKELRDLNPQWDDERIYQEARKIVGAIAQVITYQEYLPEILGGENLDCLLGNYAGYDPTIDGSIPNSFATAAYRFGHSQLQEGFNRIDGNEKSLTPLLLVDAFFNPQAFFDNGGTDTFLRGLLKQQSRNIDEFVTTTLTNRLFERKDEVGMDLASLNIQRGRDHGLPSYRMFRNFCTQKFGLRGQIEDPTTRQRLRELYNSEDDIDLWVGGLAETPLPGGRIGPTFACIFAITFKGLREGDRFYYENPGVFTPEQLNEIKKASLSRVICDNGDDIRKVQPNAFSTIQAKQNCGLLPSIQLAQWKERERETCYMNVRIDTVARSITTLYTKCSTDRRYRITDQVLTTFDGVSIRNEVCLKFPCPTVGDECQVEMRTRIRSSLCRLTHLNANALRPIRNTAGLLVNHFNVQTHFRFYRSCEAHNVLLAIYNCLR